MFTQSQNYPDPAYWQVERIPVLDHIGSGPVKGVAEDHLGYLWIGSNNGIARYDGYKYKLYPFNAGDSTSINHSRVSFVYFALDSTLWIGTRLGINRYIPECDCFKHYDVETSPSNSVPDGEINWIDEDTEGALWVVSQNGGLYRYQKDKDDFERFLYQKDHPIDISNFQARSLLCDKDGWIWIGTGETFVPSITGDGLIRFNPSTGAVKQYLHDPKDNYSLIDNRVSALLQDSKGRIWVGSCESGLHLYDKVNDRFIRMVETENFIPEIFAAQADIAPWSACPHIRTLHEDHWGGIWVATFNGGLYRFDPDKGPRLFRYQENNDRSLSSNLIWTFFEDSQARFWVGKMSANGFSKIDPYKNKFQVRFVDKLISTIYEAPSEPGVFWVGLWEAGFYRWDSQTGEYQHFKASSSPTAGPASNVIACFYEDHDQELWLATNKGLSFYNRQTGKFTHYPIGIKESAVQESVSFLDIHQDKEGIFWLASWGSGLYRFDKTTGDYLKYPLPYLGGDEGNTYNQSIYEIEEDSQGRLWLGTWMEGLYHFDRSTEKFTRYLPGIGVNKIYEHQPGQFWLGTKDFGLINFSTEKGIIQSFTMDHGLPDNTILSILSDKTGQLWLSSNHGIAKFDPVSESTVNFDKSDGLISLGYQVSSAFKALDGTFYFGSDKGLAYFRPGQIFPHPVPPRMQISDIKIFDKSLSSGEVDSSGIILPEIPQSLVLPHSQKELTFEYVGLHFSAPAHNQYRHRLIPYEKQWVEAGTKRSARYTNLNPGSYRFEAIASNSDGLWAKEPAFIDIRILPPWWKTWWAYMLYGLTTTLILFGIYSYQKRRWALQTSLEREQEESTRLRELDEFKSRFYANITHEFRTPLTVIQGLSDQILENTRWKITEKVQLIKRNSGKLLDLINQLLDLSKLEAGKLKPEYIQGDIIQYFSYLIESFQSLAFNHKLTIAFNPHTESLLMDYDPEKCQQIISNLLSNAIKFTPEYGKITVRLRVLPQPDQPVWLEVVVKDTGPGIPDEKLPYIFDRFYQADNSTVRKAGGTGLGLALVKELLELMGGGIQVKSKIDKGTSFVFTLPIHNEAEIKHPNLDYKIRQESKFGQAPLLKPTATTNNGDLPMALIVEDNLDVIYYLRSCLEQQYQIIEAKNGRIGIEQAIEHIPDIIISDVMMPEVDGYTLCQTLKTDERTSHIPVILLTAKVTQEDKMEGLTHGADVYLTKPFQKEELILRLENLIELRQQLQQRYLSGTEQAHEHEDPFLKKIQSLIESNLENADFNAQHLSQKLGLSRVQVHRKIKALTDYSTAQYIRSIRLNKAHDLLKNTDLTIAEICYQVGFKDPSHFSRTFLEAFGLRPSETRN